MAAREQPVVARDFLGLGMGDILNGDGVMGKQDLSSGAGRRSIPPFLNNVTMQGIENPAWHEAATMQHFLPLRASPNDRLKEPIAKKLPENSFPRVIPPLQIQDLASYTQKNGLCTQGDSLIKSSTTQGREECGPSIPISGGPSAIRTMISPANPAESIKAVNGPPEASKLRLPSSGMPVDVEHDPPLTIFYAGSVKVFNKISPEQAEAIMNQLARASNPVTNAVKMSCANTSTREATPSPLLHYNETSSTLLNLHIALVSPHTTAHQLVNDQSTTNYMQPDLENLTLPLPASSPLVPATAHHQPMVPTGLPHARKASLARFLEKRRERAHSKCPYLVKWEDSSLPEERLSSSNDPACYTHITPCNDRVAEC